MIDQGTEPTTRVLDLLDALPIMILHVNPRQNVVFANKRARDRIGLPTDLEEQELELGDLLDDTCAGEAREQIDKLFDGDIDDITSVWKLKTRSAGDIHVDTNAVAIYENGNPMTVRLFLHDGSDPTLAPAPATGNVGELKAALKEEQEYTKALIQKSGLLVYILDTKNNVVEVNKKMEEVTGFSREMTPSLDALLAGLYPDPKYRGIVERIHQNMYKNQHIRETELSITTRANEIKHICWSTARLKNARGQVHGFIAMGVEVSEKKRYEQWVKLQKSCFDRVSDAVVVSDLKGQIINWVGGAERLLGYTATDMVGQPMSKLFPEEYRTEISEALHEAIDRDGKWSSEMVMTTSEGNELSVRLDAAVILNEKGAPIALASVIHDQSREKQFEQQLQGEHQEIEEAAQTIEQQEQNIGELQGRVDELEQRIEYFANKNRDLEQEANRISSGRVVLESAIKELQIYQIQILATSSVAILTVDRQGTVLTWSQGAEELTGLTESATSGQHVDQVFKLEEFDWELIQAEAIEKGRLQITCTLVKEDGEKQSLLMETSVLTDESEEPIAFTLIGVVPSGSGHSEEFDEELIGAKNMATLGELTAGISRELGNASGALIANWKRLQDYSSDLKKVVELYRNGVSNRDIEAFVRSVDLKSILSDLDFLFDESKEGLTRLRNLAQDIDNFLPDDLEETEVLKLDEVVDSAISLVRADLQNRAKIDKTYHDAILVSAGRNALMRMVMYPLIAALKTFPEADSSKNEVKVKTGLDGDRAVLEIIHNGPSLEEGVEDRLDEVAYLASRSGSLPLCLGLLDQLVKKAEGSLELDRPQDGGLTLKIKLPAFDADQHIAVPVDQERTAPEHNVLFIDDNKNQLRSYRRYLERYYNIFQADSSEEALNALSVRKDFAAVVMDILLPEEDGIELYEKLIEKAPELKERVVFVLPSGLSEPTRKYVSETGHVVLHKPVRMDSLASLLGYVTRTEKAN